MKTELPLVVDELEQMAKPIKDKEAIEQVATISAQDPEIGKLIAELEEQVKSGVITVEEGQTMDLPKR